jgi:superfamily II DNA or RNA helicase
LIHRPTLRPYQAAIIEDLRQAYRPGARAPLLVLPTGGGKTLVFARAAAMATAKGRSVLILLHRRELLIQASVKLTAAGVPHGIIVNRHANGTPDRRAKGTPFRCAWTRPGWPVRSRRRSGGQPGRERAVGR